jgi:uncharacterized protein DUF551
MQNKYPIESDARTTPPSFDELVGLIKKLFKDSLEITKAFTVDEIESGWQRYKTLNHLYQDGVAATEAVSKGSDAVEWISVDERLPIESGRYWCYVQQLTDLGFSYFQWNCDYNVQLSRFADMTLKGGHQITHWMSLPVPPKQQSK